MEDVSWTDEPKAPVLVRMFHAKARIIARVLVTDPPAIVLHVRSVADNLTSAFLDVPALFGCARLWPPLLHAPSRGLRSPRRNVLVFTLAIRVFPAAFLRLRRHQKRE